MAKKFANICIPNSEKHTMGSGIPGPRQPNGESRGDQGQPGDEQNQPPQPLDDLPEWLQQTNPDLADIANPAGNDTLNNQENQRPRSLRERIWTAAEQQGRLLPGSVPPEEDIQGDAPHDDYEVSSNLLRRINSDGRPNVPPVFPPNDPNDETLPGWLNLTGEHDMQELEAPMAEGNPNKRIYHLDNEKVDWEIDTSSSITIITSISKLPTLKARREALALLASAPERVLGIPPFDDTSDVNKTIWDLVAQLRNDTDEVEENKRFYSKLRSTKTHEAYQTKQISPSLGKALRADGFTLTDNTGETMYRSSDPYNQPPTQIDQHATIVASTIRELARQTGREGQEKEYLNAQLVAMTLNGELSEDQNEILEKAFELVEQVVEGKYEIHQAAAKTTYASGEQANTENMQRAYELYLEWKPIIDQDPENIEEVIKLLGDDLEQQNPGPVWQRLRALSYLGKNSLSPDKLYNYWIDAEDPSNPSRPRIQLVLKPEELAFSRYYHDIEDGDRYTDLLSYAASYEALKAAGFSQPEQYESRVAVLTPELSPTELDLRKPKTTGEIIDIARTIQEQNILIDRTTRSFNRNPIHDYMVRNNVELTTEEQERLTRLLVIPYENLTELSSTGNGDNRDVLSQLIRRTEETSLRQIHLEAPLGINPDEYRQELLILELLAAAKAEILGERETKESQFREAFVETRPTEIYSRTYHEQYALKMLDDMETNSPELRSNIEAPYIDIVLTDIEGNHEHYGIDRNDAFQAIIDIGAKGSHRRTVLLEKIIGGSFYLERFNNEASFAIIDASSRSRISPQVGSRIIQFREHNPPFDNDETREMLLKGYLSSKYITANKISRYMLDYASRHHEAIRNNDSRELEVLNNLREVFDIRYQLPRQSQELISTSIAIGNQALPTSMEPTMLSALAVEDIWNKATQDTPRFFTGSENPNRDLIRDTFPLGDNPRLNAQTFQLLEEGRIDVVANESRMRDLPIRADIIQSVQNNSPEMLREFLDDMDVNALDLFTLLSHTNGFERRPNLRIEDQDAKEAAYNITMQRELDLDEELLVQKEILEQEAIRLAQGPKSPTILFAQARKIVEINRPIHGEYEQITPETAKILISRAMSISTVESQEGAQGEDRRLYLTPEDQERIVLYLTKNPGEDSIAELPLEADIRNERNILSGQFRNEEIEGQFQTRHFVLAIVAQVNNADLPEREKAQILARELVSLARDKYMDASPNIIFNQARQWAQGMNVEYAPFLAQIAPEIETELIRTSSPEEKYAIADNVFNRITQNIDVRNEEINLDKLVGLDQRLDQVLIGLIESDQTDTNQARRDAYRGLLNPRDEVYGRRVPAAESLVIAIRNKNVEDIQNAMREIGYPNNILIIGRSLKNQMQQLQNNMRGQNSFNPSTREEIANIRYRLDLLRQLLAQQLNVQPQARDFRQDIFKRNRVVRNQKIA